MKITPTIEQSAELIKRGVSAGKASMVCMNFNGTYAYVSGEEAQTVRDCVNGQFYVEESRVFALADLLSLLPKEIKRDSLDRPYVLHIIREEDRTIAAYRRDWDSITGADKRTSEFIDSLYELLLWAIDHNHVKLD